MTDDGGVFSKSLKSTFRTFCLVTTQHGFKHLALPKRTLFERCLWFIIILGSFVGIGTYTWLVNNVYLDQINEIVTVSTHLPIWNFYFPAVTICDLNKISKAKANKQMDRFKSFGGTNYTQETFRKDFKLLYQLIFPNNDSLYGRLTQFQAVLNANDISAADLLDEISPGCDVVLRCKFKGDVKRCTEYFRRVVTMHGYCCSFNNFAFDKSVLGFDGPRKSAQSGYQSSLQVLLDQKSEDVEVYDQNAYGYGVFTHFPFNYVDFSSMFMLVAPMQSNLVAVTATALSTSGYLLNTNSANRACLLRKENQLRMFSVYTHRNCAVECRMDVILQHCKCVPFYYNVGKVKGTARVCNLGDVPCVNKMKELTINSEYTLKSCNCPEDCYVDVYRFEYSGGTISRNFALYTNNLGNGINITNHSMLRVHFTTDGYLENERTEQYNFTSYLALLGGIMGLFNGIGILSIVEMIYFFPIRLRVQMVQRNSELKTVKAKRIFVAQKHHRF